MGPQRRRLGNTDITKNTRLHPSVCRKLFTCLQSVFCFFPSGTLGIKAAAPLTGLYGVLPGGWAPSLTSISLETCVSHSLIAWMSFLQFWEEIISLYSLKWKTSGKKKNNHNTNFDTWTSYLFKTVIHFRLYSYCWKEKVRKLNCGRWLKRRRLKRMLLCCFSDWASKCNIFHFVTSPRDQ